VNGKKQTKQQTGTAVFCLACGVATWLQPCQLAVKYDVTNFKHVRHRRNA